MVGQTLGHYTILAKIGSGGMGEVYLAEDQTLNRRVALKVLPRELASGERSARFAREAKALAALNHPSIVTVYSVEEHGGIPFITMELVEGVTLADLLPRDGWPLDRFFDLAIPLADAVAAAHQHGIVHRDLKPGNVMVTADGRVKVLDFGLAKAVGGLAATSAGGEVSTAAMTEAGTIVGTRSYMSPEQARGQPVDARSDIFALGVVFYEMLTGRRPFAGDTPTDVLSSIIKDAPPAVSSIRAGIPRELARLVRRCLAKDPSRRVQSALDIRNELEELKREMDSGELLADPRPAQVRLGGSRNAWWAAAAAVGIVVLGGVYGGGRWLEPNEARAIRLSNPRQLTFTTGVETNPTWSPDRGRVAYVSDQSGNEDIWVSPSAGGAAVNFTADHSGFDRDPSWSPDGNQLAFVSERDGGGIYVMPAIGGRALRLSLRGSSEGLTNPQWSADGTELAHMRREDEGNVIEVVSVATRESRRLRIPGSAGNRFDLSWSPDGRFFAYVRAPNRNEGISRVWLLRASDAQEVAVTDGTSNDWSPIWSPDARTLFYVSNRGGSMDLWRQGIGVDGTPVGDASPITVGIGMQKAALTPDGRKLAYSKGQPVANVWRVPILESREATWEDAEQLTFDQANVQSLDLFPDGERLLVDSDRSGYRDLWTVQAKGGEMRQLTTDRAPDSAARLSPDGKRIAFYSYRSGNRDIWVMPSEGGPAVQLTRNPGVEMGPSWSPDGLRIAFYSDREGSTDLFSAPAGGGEAGFIYGSPSSEYFPEWSPDGKWMAFLSTQPDAVQRLWKIPLPGGPPERLTADRAGHFRWSGDSSRIYFRKLPGDDLWSLTLADGTERRLTRFSQRAGGIAPYTLAVGHAHLYFGWRADLGDIWVVDVVPDGER